MEVPAAPYSVGLSVNDRVVVVVCKYFSNPMESITQQLLKLKLT